MNMKSPSMVVKEYISKLTNGRTATYDELNHHLIEKGFNIPEQALKKILINEYLNKI